MVSLVPSAERSDLLDRVKRRLVREGSTRGDESLLLATASRYSPQLHDDESTPPTGFDLEAATLFEAIVESAFLVANADGEFDQAERDVFALVVTEASERRVSESQVQAIVLDLATQLQEDGLERRIRHLGHVIPRIPDRREALRIAALLARASAGVSRVERQTLERLAAVWELDASTVEQALTEW